MERLTEREIRALLAITMAYDNRRASDAAVLAWGEVADRARWTFDEAKEAIHTHYASSTEFLMPAHITAEIRRARDTRSLPPKFDRAAIEPASPASEETRRKAMEQIRRFTEKTRIDQP